MTKKRGCAKTKRMNKFLSKLKNFRKPEKNGFEKGAQSENQAFLKLASFQFKELAKKGLSIPVFTL